MLDYKSRIPATDDYKQALGQLYYNFAAASWQLVYLFSLHSDGYVSLASNQPSSVLERDFEVLAAASQDAVLGDLVKRYSVAVNQRNELMASVGITYVNGEQMLSGVNGAWTIERLNGLAKEIEEIDIEANSLYYRRKASA